MASNTTVIGAPSSVNLRPSAAAAWGISTTIVVSPASDCQAVRTSSSVSAASTDTGQGVDLQPGQLPGPATVGMVCPPQALPIRMIEMMSP
ncbi:MAG: hypothetical protein IPO80_07990 [Propionibacteriaceae bacterium]|nr:hypothetical protein [Propionibacteriaceae bacterium]